MTKNKVLDLSGRELDEAVNDIVMAQPGRGPDYKTAKILPAPAFSSDANATRKMENWMGELGLGYEYSEELLRLVGYIDPEEEHASSGIWLGSQAELSQKCHAALLAVLSELELNERLYGKSSDRL